MEAKQASAQIGALAGDICSGRTIRNEFPRPTDANDRVLGTELAGAIARSRIFEDGPESNDDVLASLEFNGGSVAGQGLGAFNAYGVSIRVEGGAQDGVGKAMLGGTIAILKGKGAKGKRLNGSVGKSFAYGAQRGRLFVQGSADSRFCIRLSGADVVLAGEPEHDIDDSRGCIVDRANAKGFAFEYMTSGRAVVLGDLGPWACAGMTGGRVYVRHNAFGIDREAIERRLGEGAKVELKDLDAEGLIDIDDLLSHYAEELRATGQDEEADRILEPGRRRDQQLPDGRAPQGPGGPEHLDRVESARSGGWYPSRRLVLIFAAEISASGGDRQKAEPAGVRAPPPPPTCSGQQPVGDRPHLPQQPVEHALGVAVDPVLGGLAVGLDLVDALLQLAGALVDLADRALHAASRSCGRAS